MITEEIYSPIKDEKIASNIAGSPIWAKAFAFTKDEYDEWKHSHDHWYRYTIKFDGLKPVQFLKMEEL